MPNNKKISVCVNDNTPFYFGQKIYVVERAGSVFLKTPCPVCNNTKKIIHKGFELTCPHCSNGKDNTGILVSDFVVHEYIVHRCTIWGEEVKSRYGENNTSENKAQWTAFCVLRPDKKHSISGIDTKNLYPYEVFDETRDKHGWAIKTWTRTSSKSPFDLIKPIHINKKTAKKMCEEIIAAQKKMLDEFNEKNKTEYKYPF